MKDKLSKPIESDIPYIKRSKKKGLSRADHKHQYETVLLKHTCRTAHVANTEFYKPTKVCRICGRIGDVDTDPSYYAEMPQNAFAIRYLNVKLSSKALDLDIWYAGDVFDKFAQR